MNIIVSGAFGDLGRAVSRELSALGHSVLRAGRLRAAERPLSAPGWCTDVAGDLSEPAGWEAVSTAVATAGRPADALVHCAGTLVAEDFLRMSPAALNGQLRDNILSLMLGFQAVLPGMLERRRGHLVVVGSLGGIVPMPHHAVYASTKFAVRGFVLSMAQELRDTGVRVSLLSCGPVDGRMLRREASVEGTIGFVNPPLSPDAVAVAVARLLDHPAGESYLPRSQALAAPLAGAYVRLFELLHPVASAAGNRGKRRYLASMAVNPAASEEQP